MKNFFSKLFRFLIRIWKTFCSDCRFSIYYAFLRVIDEFAARLHWNALSNSAHNAKDQWLLRFLKKQLRNTIALYQNDKELGEAKENSPIWICWWTGLDSAPALVQKCIASSYKNAGTHPVHLITQENYSDYLQIPAYMLEKVKDGKMGLAHLADYIRVKLLADYGGLWLDATIFCSQTLPSLCFELPVSTLKGPVRKSRYISDYRWVTFCLGGWKGNVFYRFLADAFEEYWSQNDYAVDYLFFDHIILTAYNELPEIRKLLDGIPDNNIHRDDLQAAMNAALPADQFDEIVKDDTVLYKLSWREEYKILVNNRTHTIFYKFLNLPF